jgi:hypothetical protein
LALDGKSAAGEEARDIARRHRAEQLADIGGLPYHQETLAVELGADDIGLFLQFEVTRFELHLHAFELGAVILGGAQRLALREQEIARETVLDAHDLAHLAELGDTFEQNHFHGFSPLSGRFSD